MDILTTETPDVLILGGGVAGSGLGISLARSGLEVTIVERAPVFRDRIRGESVHPWGVKEMRQVGLLDVALEKAGGRLLPFWTKYSDREAGDPYRWTDDFPDLPGSLSVRHEKLQQAQLEEADAAGATVLRPASVTEISWTGRHPEVHIATESGRLSVRARLLVGADGAHSLTRRFLGGIAVTDLPHHAIGGTLLSGINLPDQSAHQAFFDGGFAMIFPQQGQTSRVYYVCSSEVAQEMQVSDTPVLLLDRLADALPDGVLDHATVAGPTGFFPTSETLSTVTYGSSTVLVGDAAATNDPSQGHGLSLIYRDIRDLTDRLIHTRDWSDVPEQFAWQRTQDHGVLRAHAQWVAPLSTGTGPDAERLKEQVALAREQDPTAGGFAAIFATGPAGLTADEAARRHFLGEDLQTALTR